MCDKWIGRQSVHRNTVREHFIAFELNHLNRKSNCIWRIVWLSVIWNVWIHRNNIVFKNRYQTY